MAQTTKMSFEHLSWALCLGFMVVMVIFVHHRILPVPLVVHCCRSSCGVVIHVCLGGSRACGGDTTAVLNINVSEKKRNENKKKTYYLWRTSLAFVHPVEMVAIRRGGKNLKNNKILSKKKNM
jgi:hypothetical protein